MIFMKNYSILPSTSLLLMINFDLSFIYFGNPTWTYTDSWEPSFLSAIAIGTFPFDKVVLSEFLRGHTHTHTYISTYIMRYEPKELAFTKAKQIKKSFTDYIGCMQIPRQLFGGKTGSVHILYLPILL